MKFATRIKRLNKLQVLDLNLTGCFGIKEKGLKHLGETFSKWLDLKKFTLNLDRLVILSDSNTHHF